MCKYFNFGRYLRNLYRTTVITIYLRTTADGYNHWTLIAGLHNGHQIPIFAALQFVRSTLQEHLYRIYVTFGLHLQRVQGDVVQVDVIFGTSQDVDHIDHGPTVVGFRQTEGLLSAVKDRVGREGALPMSAVLRSVRRWAAIFRMGGFSSAGQWSPGM